MSKRELSNLSHDWLHGGKRKKNEHQSTEAEYKPLSLGATMMWKKMWQQKRERECSEVLGDIISQVQSASENNTEAAISINGTSTNATNIDNMH